MLILENMARNLYHISDSKTGIQHSKKYLGKLGKYLGNVQIAVYLVI